MGWGLFVWLPVIAGLHDRELRLAAVVLDPEERDGCGELVVKGRTGEQRWRRV